MTGILLDYPLTGPSCRPVACSLRQEGQPRWVWTTMSFWDGVWRSGDGRLALLPTGEIFLLDKRDGVSYNLNSVSGITRGENDIAFASHGGGHPAGDVYLYTVNDNAYWDTIFYCDLRIVKT